MHTYTWDADGNSVTLDSVGLTFDALDRMVEQNRSGAYTQIVYAPAGGKLALMSGQTLQKAFVPLPGQATAVYTTSGLDHYRHSDWLGSARLTSSPSRAYISSWAYAPFGEIYSSSGTTDPSFTGQNSDTVSNDYDFLFREYSTQGRWPSPDPAGLAAADASSPRSWNRYGYTLNDPLDLVDPLGLDTKPPEPQKCFVNGFEFIGGDICDLIYANLCRLIVTMVFQGVGGGSVCLNRSILGDSVKQPRDRDREKPQAKPQPPVKPTIGPGPPGIPPNPLACSRYLDGTGAGSILFRVCMGFPNGPWSNCVREKLLNQYVPKGNPLDLSIYLFWDHPKDFPACAIQ